MAQDTIHEKTTPKEVYNALRNAADKIGTNNYRSQIQKHKNKGRAVSTFKFRVTPAHAQVIDAMPKVLSGVLSVECAMAILHEHDVMEERF